jgi:hypothetical protein
MLAFQAIGLLIFVHGDASLGHLQAFGREPHDTKYVFKTLDAKNTMVVLRGVEHKLQLQNPNQVALDVFSRPAIIITLHFVTGCR